MKPMDRYGVLIVDDSGLMRHMIADLFEAEPQFYVAGTARNGLEALERTAEARPDLIVLDVEMPEMDGLTALPYMINHFQVPVVMLSSYTYDGSTQTLQAMRLGAADYFHKDMLFGKPHNRLAGEDFVQRCKIAIERGVDSSALQLTDSKDMAINIMLEWVHHSVRLEEELRAAQRELARIMNDYNGMMLHVTKRQDKFVHTCGVGQLLTRIGFKPEHIVGKELHDVFPGPVADRLLNAYREAWIQRDTVRFETVIKGLTFVTALKPVVRSGEVCELIVVCADITEQRRMEERMHYLSNHDQLTGLPNRTSITGLLRQTILDAKAAMGSFAVFFTGLDHFKLINDTLGHEIGDRVLQIAARRLERSARGGRKLGRAGGDTFVLIVPQDIPERIASEAELLVSCIHDPIRLNGQNIHTSLCIGISRYPQDATEAESLLASAEMAMYDAKESHSGSYRFYSAHMNKRFHKRMELENELRGSIETGELHLMYQPVIETRTGKVVGMESLIRWDNRHLGRVSPAEFIPVAEETGLIHEIGRWVLQEACRQNKQWQDAGLPKLFVAVNLSSRQFFDPRLIRTIGAILEETGLQPQYLELEITESMTLDVKLASEALGELKRLGVKVAMDDFGTGYSSLGYLKDFPIDKLKIDQSFVKQLHLNPVNAAIVNTMIAMAQNLDLMVVAEGVETEEELRVLKQYGCGLVQGYHFSPPADAATIAQLVGQLNG